MQTEKGEILLLNGNGKQITEFLNFTGSQTSLKSLNLGMSEFSWPMKMFGVSKNVSFGQNSVL